MRQKILKMYGPPPVHKRDCWAVDVSVCFNVSGLYFGTVRSWPRWVSARLGPHKTLGLSRPFFRPGFQDAGSTVSPSRWSRSQTLG